jgi:cell fate regulator YaaT (PSP1 superfamily)
MIDVFGVSFELSNKIYYFSPNNLELEKGEKVIVETERGEQFGEVVTNKINVDPKKLVSAIKPILRKATKEDEKTNKNNVKDALKAKEDAEKIVNDLNLDMKILDASFTFDRKQLLFHFLADDRIDFRELAKRLAKIYCTRIELRQIGVRDKAKIVGGYGQCGRQLCCHLFLNDLNAVSINMAKNQNLALNPQKINGLCGRLMCCLNYENSIYEEGIKKLPKVNSIVNSKYGKGKVVAIDPINNSYKIEIEEKGIFTVEV